MQQPKARQEMDPRWMWDLNDILNGTPAFDALFAQTERDIDAWQQCQGRVAEDPQAAIRGYFAIERAVERMFTYARMRQDEDGGDAAAQTLLARIQSLATRAASAGAFLQPELLSLPEQTLEGLKNDPDFSEYSMFIENLLRDKPHTLPAAQEKLLAQLGEIMQAPDDIYTMLSDVDRPLPEVEDENGQSAKLSPTVYMRMLRSRNRNARKTSYETEMNAYGVYRQTMAATYRYNVKSDVARARVRGFGSAIEAALHPDRVPVRVYDNLLESVEAALPALNKYLALRKKQLRVDELHLYDLYVSIVDGFDMPLTYPEAFALVKKGLAPLGEHYRDLLDKAYSEHWIDVYENKGKHTGAYSWGVYDSHPYVLLNHTDDLSGAMTLAHELGHAMHTWHSNNAQPYAKAGYSLFVAEVASTCNEMLLMRFLLDTYKEDAKASAFLLNQLLEEFRGTVFRQTMFAAFEREAHRMEEEGIPLTAESLGEAHYKLNQKYYGGGCVIDDCVRHEWMRIPHFYSSFYVYKYATSFSAAVYISHRILTEGRLAVEDYMRFLSAGGSVPPVEALKLAGVDMEDPSTVRDALKVFADTVDQLEALL
ncbi:MAG: oligoendopeptidase F [Clostridia bacterium]|nr:oligoendopeptidase F [Clostridia bacterium]